MIPIIMQLKVFLNTLAMGIIIGIIFDFYQALRRLFHVKSWIQGITDLVFSLLCTGIVFALLIFSNWGEVRFYVFIGLFLGSYAYFKLLHKTIYRFWLTWLRGNYQVIKFVITIFLIPLSFLGGGLIFAFKCLKYVHYYFKKAIKKPISLSKLFCKKMFTWRPKKKKDE